MRVLLVGNPNCGKTTIFNALTNHAEPIGNWAGVTVEQKIADINLHGYDFSIVDLPGVYSLCCFNADGAQDELITAKAVVALEPDIIVNIIDASALERHLYLTSQLLELQKPMLIVLNMMDSAKKSGVNIDVAALSKYLSCPVICTEAHKNINLGEIRHELVSLAVNYAAFTKTKSSLMVELPQDFTIVDEITTNVLAKTSYDKTTASYIAMRMLEGDISFIDYADAKLDSYDIMMADLRYQKVHDCALKVCPVTGFEKVTTRIDKIVLNRFLSLPIFLLIMYSIFFLSIQIGGVFQDFFEQTCNAVFVQIPSYILQHLSMPSWVVVLCSEGLGQGITTTLSFVPVLAIFFFLLALFEISGYMARAAFVMDRFMRALGLPGKAFVPMIIGFGCNVPAVLAARTMEAKNDRILTILMTPFMSCAARLAIYLVFVAAFFPEHGHNIVFSLYLTGIILAVLTGFLLRKVLFKGQVMPLFLELPHYHLPSIARLLRETWVKLKVFIVRAYKMIVPVCFFLTLLQILNFSNGKTPFLQILGEFLTPMFQPIGISADNWPATLSLIFGFIAKEIVVGSLVNFYTYSASVMQHKVMFAEILQQLTLAAGSIKEHVLQVFDSNAAPTTEITHLIKEHFHTKISAYAYLLFVLLYVPCVSTVAVIKQETNLKLMWASVLWSLFLAYTVSLIFYQVAQLCS
jgi:ferrous iron transport protein B